ncbi:MAG: spiro-SPASM protein, partial [Treponema sp.]|nr:spiro-SPASM protein [Treponema sp.]
DFCADSKHNLLLLKNFINASGGIIPGYREVEKITEEKPEILRTLPNFYPVQVYGGCPQKCVICPYPSLVDVSVCKDFMPCEKFEQLLEKIVSFSGSAVIDISLWGELSLHPEKLKLIEAVLSHKELALVIETSGLGWKQEDLDKSAALAANAASGGRENPLPPLSWIISLDACDPKRYNELRSGGFAEAESCVKKLFSLFPQDTYVQSVRVKGSEDDTEKFYRYWKDASPAGDKNVIIQKYDDFCGYLEKKQASDISPVIRKSCWHIMRDFPVLLDGSVPLCREDLKALKGDKNNILGNVFDDSLENIWQKSEKYYIEHCGKKYQGICADCDEYYTYNF